MKVPVPAIRAGLAGWIADELGTSGWFQQPLGDSRQSGRICGDDAG